jgi:hypothetical protein
MLGPSSVDDGAMLGAASVAGRRQRHVVPCRAPRLCIRSRDNSQKSCSKPKRNVQCIKDSSPCILIRLAARYARGKRHNASNVVTSVLTLSHLQLPNCSGIANLTTVSYRHLQLQLLRLHDGASEAESHGPTQSRA